jgi:hypothetical protein
MFDDIIRNITSFRPRGGMFTTAIRLLMVLTFAVLVICVVIKIWWLILILVTMLFALLFYTIHRLFNFADRNPLVAILEGSEPVRLEETKQGKKSQDDLPISPPTIDHEPPVIPEAEILAPDAPPEPPQLRSPPMQHPDGPKRNA